MCACFKSLCVLNATVYSCSYGFIILWIRQGINTLIRSEPSWYNCLWSISKSFTELYSGLQGIINLINFTAKINHSCCNSIQIIIILLACCWHFGYWHFNWYWVTLVDHFLLCSHWLIVKDSYWISFSWKRWWDLCSLYIGDWWCTKERIPPKYNLVNQCVYCACRSMGCGCLEEYEDSKTSTPQQNPLLWYMIPSWKLQWKFYLEMTL